MSDQSSITGLNLLPSQESSTSEMSGTSSHDHSTADVSLSLAKDLEMWTTFSFEPRGSSSTPAAENASESSTSAFFSAARDTASRSRHKSTNPPDPFLMGPDGGVLGGLKFFGGVGAAFEAQQSSEEFGASAMDPLFSYGMDAIFSNVGMDGVDPFLVPPVFPGGGSGLPPLTIRDERDTTEKTTIDPQLSTLTPPTKRQRTSKKQHTASLSVSSDSPDNTSPTSLHGDSQIVAAVSQAEDKRRRNTLASARFRLKKKERELAMEKKAKELDDKVSKLERECETLRKENGWLKGLVVGATTGEGISLGGDVGGKTVDLDELIKALRASGAVVTDSGSSAKRKRTEA